METNKQQWKKEMKGEENKFVEEFTNANPEWVKARRLDFLYDCWREEMRIVSKYICLSLECSGEIYQWIAKVFVEDYIKPAQKKIRKLKWEIGLWNNPELIVPGRLSEEDIERAKEVPCKDFLDIVREENGRAWSLCPFHSEKTPSFCCYEDNNRFTCFSCGRNGDVIQLVRDLYNLEFVEAVNFILRRA